MRLPAARRFAAAILRATITASDSFISILLQLARATGRFYRTSDRRIPGIVSRRTDRSLQAWKDEDRSTRVVVITRNITRESVERLPAAVCALAEKQPGDPACISSSIVI
jgi:hypothetical protein